MKKKAFLLGTMITLITICVSAQETWTRKADFGGSARGYGAGFSIAGKIYMGLGFNGGSPKDFWEYDPSSNAWVQKADFPGEARDQTAGFSVNGKGYITGGKNAGPNYVYYADLWEYDPVLDKWTRKADFPGTARAFTTAFSIGSKGYFGTGYRYDTGTFSDFWEYDPAVDKWTRKADYNGGGRSNPTSFSIGGKGYLGIGWNGGWTTDFREYDPATDTWTRKANFGGAAREWAAGFSAGGKGYIGTGYNFSYYKDFWEYDPAINAWDRKADLAGVARNGALGFSAGDKGYIGIGFSGSVFLNDFWEYTPESINCSAPTALKVTNAADTSVVLHWSSSGASTFKIRYRAVGSTQLIKRNVKGNNDHVAICNLTPNTTYEWQMRSNCMKDTSAWVCGPNFTTASATFALMPGAISASDIKVNNVSILVAPNPGNGNFTIQMHLPAKEALTTLALYNSQGERVWQQQAEMLSGTVTKSIAMNNKLSAGIYILRIERNDIRLMQKVVVSK